MHHHPTNHERALNLSILLQSGPGKFPRVESNYNMVMRVCRLCDVTSLTHTHIVLLVLAHHHHGLVLQALGGGYKEGGWELWLPPLSLSCSRTHDASFRMGSARPLSRGRGVTPPPYRHLSARYDGAPRGRSPRDWPQSMWRSPVPGCLAAKPEREKPQTKGCCSLLLLARGAFVGYGQLRCVCACAHVCV